MIKKLKPYIRIGSFVIIVFLVILALSFTIFAPSSVTKLDSSLTSNYSYANEPDNSIQIIGIGNSDLNSGLIPNIIWEECGYTSNIAASARQTPETSYKRLQTVLKKQSPNLVIIETDMLYEDGVSGEGVSLKGRLNLFFEFLDTNAFNTAMEDNLTLFKFHDVWKKFFSNEEATNIDIFTHGYRYNNHTNGVSLNGFMTKSDEVDPLKEEDIKYMTEIVNLCRNKNIDVVFLEILSPYSWTYPRHNAVQELADSLNVDFIDSNLLVNEIGFDESKDFRDIGNHLNYYGASKLTKYLCDYINTNYSYENRLNNPDYTYWQESCDEFRKRIK